MNFRIKETIYVSDKSGETIIRIGTQGFSRNGVIYFPDVQAERFVGFPKGAVMTMKDLFKVSTTREDTMVHLDDITKAIGETEEMDKELRDKFLMNLSKYIV